MGWGTRCKCIFLYIIWKDFSVLGEHLHLTQLFSLERQWVPTSMVLLLWRMDSHTAGHLTLGSSSPSSLQLERHHWVWGNTDLRIYDRECVSICSNTLVSLRPRFCTKPDASPTSDTTHQIHQPCLLSRWHHTAQVLLQGLCVYPKLWVLPGPDTGCSHILFLASGEPENVPPMKAQSPHISICCLQSGSDYSSQTSDSSWEETWALRHHLTGKIPITNNLQTKGAKSHPTQKQAPV